MVIVFIKILIINKQKKFLTVSQVCVIELFFVILLKHQTRMVGIRMTDPSFLCQGQSKIVPAWRSKSVPLGLKNIVC